MGISCSSIKNTYDSSSSEDTKLQIVIKNLEECIKMVERRIIELDEKIKQDEQKKIRNKNYKILIVTREKNKKYYEDLKIKIIILKNKIKNFEFCCLKRD